MKFFERFKKKQPSCPQAAETDTMGLLVMDRVMQDACQAGEVVKKAFGAEALGEIDQSNPPVIHLVVKLEGTEFWCSYMPFPVPQEEMNIPDISQSVQYCLYNTEECQAFCNSKSFWLIVQKGGGNSLEGKRKVCCLFTRLAGALLELEGAVGVYVSAAELPISSRVYLQHVNDDFPAVLWVSIRHGQKGDIPMVGTWGLKQFGFLELWFLGAKSDWAELHQKLYMMSVFQITGKELYKDRDTIAFTKDNISVFKELQGALFIVGGDV